MTTKDHVERERDEPGDAVKWHRDLLMRLMGWGTATFLLLVGWVVDGGDQKFSFECKRAPAYDRAWALAFLVPVWAACWISALYYVRRRCPDHPTVLPAWAVLGYGAVVAIATVGVTIPMLWD